MTHGDKSVGGGGTLIQVSNIRLRVSDQVSKLRSQPIPKSVPLSHSATLSRLFDLGGVISGGAALSVIYNKPIKDVDFYFNDEQSYLKALEIVGDDKKFDICWYFDKPHELHDIGFVMCNVYRDRVEITDPAREAMESKISSLFIENVIWPSRTAKRLLKYNSRYGIRFKMSEVLAFTALTGLDTHIVKQLMAIST